MSLGFERIHVILAEEQLTVAPTSETIAIIYDVQTTVDKLNALIAKMWQTHTPISLYKRRKNFTKQLNDLVAMGISCYQTIDSHGELSDIKIIQTK